MVRLTAMICRTLPNHQLFRIALKILDLGMSGIRYFARSVMKSRMFQLHQRTKPDRYIHAAAFVAHQFYCCHDHLTDMLLNVIASLQTTVSREHKEYLVEQRKAQQQAIQTVVNDLDESVFGLIRQIRELAENGILSDTQKIEKIKDILGTPSTESFDQLKADLEMTGQNSAWFEILENQVTEAAKPYQPNHQGFEL